MEKSTGIRRSGILRALTAAVLLLALLLLVQPQQAQAASPIKGIDVSRWQGSIDWKSVKRSGVNFVMIGTGRFKNGVATEDPYFYTNIKGANNAGVNVGIYHYMTATTTSDAKAAAKYVLGLANGYKVSYPIAVDIEDSVYSSMTKTQRTDLVIAFLDVIVDAGYYPAVYASDDYFVYSLDTSRLKKKGYDFWVAAWSRDPVTTPLSMWQYTSTGTVSGISGSVDMDYSYKDYPSFVAPRYSSTKVEAGWYSDGTNTWYVKSNGSIPKSSFIKVGSKTYYVDANGYRVSGGWKSINGKYYNFKASGVMRTGWYTSRGNKYYLDPDTGARATGKTKIGSKVYYFNKASGAMQTGWVKKSGKYYYFSKSTGVMQTGWQKIKGKRYYLDPSTGAMATGWLTVKKKTYYMDETTGNPLTGLQKIGSKYYYFGKKGVMQTGWQKISGNWYYFRKSSGVMLRNTTYDGYIFGSDGVCTNR